MNHTETALRVFERVAYIPLFILGFSLNITALCIFCRIKHWTDMHIYMLNLLVADFLAILILPFKILEVFCPIQPTSLCTALLCIQFSNMYSSIFIITAISIHRFIAVRFPFLTKAMLSKSRMIATTKCVIIWVTVAVICVCNYQEFLPDKLENCYDRKVSKKFQKNFLVVLEILGYLIPVVILIFCSTQTIYILVRSLQHVEGRDRVERKNTVAIITANMFTFIVCFTPLHIGLLLQNYSVEYFVRVSLNVAEWIATTNCCLDSIGYYFLLKKVNKRDQSSY